MKGLAHAWYAPIELRALRAWTPAIVTVNLLLALIGFARDDMALVQIHIAGAVLLAGGRLLLGGSRVALGFAALAFLFAAVAGLALIEQMATLRIFDIWAAAWLILPGLFGICVARRPELGRETLSDEAVEAGLARNRRLKPRFSGFSAHLILGHAVLIVLVPLIWVLDTALSPGNILGGPLFDAITLDHFEKILGGEKFWVWMRNSLIVSLGTTLLGLLLAVPAAYAFSRWRFSGRGAAMFSFLLVQMFPGIIILVPYFLVMKSLGLLNSALGLILAYSVTALPLCVWMLKGFFDTIPRELEEAALLDGCSHTQVFTKVVLPLSLPAVGVTALFSFLAAWNEFLLALTFNTSEDMYTLPVGLASMISATGQAWGEFAAASILVSLPVVVLFILFQKSLIEGLSSGGVKG